MSIVLSSLLSFSLLGPSSFQGEHRQLLVGGKGITAKIAQDAVSGIGTVGVKERTGFYRVQLATAISPESATARIKANGIPHVFPGTADHVKPNSLHSVSTYLEYRETAAEINDWDEETSGTDFFSALKFYLEPRVNESGYLDNDVYIKAAEHRDKMPPARTDWFGSEGTQNPGGLFTYVGPKDLQIPYNTYYGAGNLSGRKTDIAYAKSNPSIIYTTSAGGGVWKSTDGGTNWVSVSETWRFLQTSCVAIHPTNPNIVYVGTGDYRGFGTAHTNGIMKTTDGGATWSAVGVSNFGTKVVSKIVLCPENPAIVVCSTGRGSSEPGGIWRSVNSGTTWTRTDAPEGDWDDLDVAGNSQVGESRAIWAVGGDMIAYSVDRGATWTSVASPDGWGGNGLSNVAASQEPTDAFGVGNVYILGSNRNLFRGTEFGEDWEDITDNVPDTEDGYNWTQAGYDICITASSNGDADSLYVGLITLSYSGNNGADFTDIGQTYQTPSKLHNDQHCFAVHPTKYNEGMSGNDGGIVKTVVNVNTLQATFTNLNKSIYDTQFYFMSLHPTNGAYVMGGTQDNASPASRNSSTQWKNLQGGDGGGSGFDGKTPAKHYTTSQKGGVFRYDTASSTSPTDLSIEADIFITPLILGGANRTTVFVGNGEYVYRNLNGTSGWTASTTEVGYVKCFSNSFNSETRLYLGTGSGDVFVSDDSGDNFTQVDGNLPDVAINDVEESEITDYHLIAAAQTNNAGSSGVWRCSNVNVANPVWTRISGSGATALPAVACNTVKRDPYEASTYYAGTDVGLFVTKNGGANWYNMNGLGLPNVQVNDLWINSNDTYLYVATFGRGIWRIPLKKTQLASMSLSTTQVYGSDRAYATVSINAPASPDTKVQMFDNSPAVATPSSVSFEVGSTSAQATLITSKVATTTYATISARLGGVGRDLVLKILPPAKIQLFTVLNNPITAGESSTLRVQLTATAVLPTKVVFTENHSFVSFLRPYLTIPAGGRIATISIKSSSVTQASTATIQAHVDEDPSVKASAQLTVLPLPTLTNFTLTPSTVKGGLNVTGKVFISRAATGSGVVIKITDSSTTAILTPTTVTIPAGRSDVSFTINTRVPAANYNGSVFAAYNGVTLKRSLYITK